MTASQLDGVLDSQPASQDSPCLRLRGLPFDVTDEDIRIFFEGFQIDHLYLMRKNGRNTGQAYVILDSAEAAAAALCNLHMKTIGLRYIEVFRTPSEDVDTAVKAIDADRRSEGHVVRLRGLPYTVTLAQIATFLAPAELEDGLNSVHVLRHPHGRPTGEAYVEMRDQKSMDLAVQQKHKQMMGRRYIEVFQTGRSAMAQALAQEVQAIPACLSEPSSMLMGQGMLLRPVMLSPTDLSNSMAGLQLGPSQPMAPHGRPFLVSPGYPGAYPGPPGRVPMGPVVAYPGAMVPAGAAGAGVRPGQPVMLAPPYMAMPAGRLPQQQQQQMQDQHQQQQRPFYGAADMQQAAPMQAQQQQGWGLQGFPMPAEGMSMVSSAVYPGQEGAAAPGPPGGPVGPRPPPLAAPGSALAGRPGVAAAWRQEGGGTGSPGGYRDSSRPQSYLV